MAPRPPAQAPLRPPSNRLLAAPAISVISEEGAESPPAAPAPATAYPLPPLPPGYREATRGPAGGRTAASSSSSGGRLRIEMPPSPAIDVSGIVPGGGGGGGGAGSDLSTPSTPLSANIAWARGEGGPAAGGGRLGLLRRRSADVLDSDDEFDKMVEVNIKELGEVGSGVGVGVEGRGGGGGTPESKVQPRQPLQKQHQPSVQHTHPMQQQQPPQQQQQQQQSGQLRQIEHQLPSSSSSSSSAHPASQQHQRPQQPPPQPVLTEVQSPTDSFTLQPIASRVKEWDAAIAEEKSTARALQLQQQQDLKALHDADHLLGIKRAAPEGRSPRLSSTDNRKPIGSEYPTEGEAQEGLEGQSEDELSKLSLAEKLKFFSALTATQPPEPPPPTSKQRGKGKRMQTRHQTQPVTSQEVEQVVSTRQRQHPYQQQQQQQYEHQQQYQSQQQYQQQQYQQQQYYQQQQQQQYQQPQYQQQPQYLQQYQQPPYQDQQYFQQYQQPLYQQQQYQQHMYQQQQTYNPVASRHIYRDY